MSLSIELFIRWLHTILQFDLKSLWNVCICHFLVKWRCERVIDLISIKGLFHWLVHTSIQVFPRTEASVTVLFIPENLFMLRLSSLSLLVSILEFFSPILGFELSFSGLRLA